MKEKVEEFIGKKIDKEIYPGCQVLIGHQGDVVQNLSLGSKVKGSASQADKVNENTLFNIESITKVMVTLPYFIPLPLPPFGTMGAVIKMGSRIPDRRALFDVGVAGPLAGLVMIIPSLIIGLHFSKVVEVSSIGSGTISLGNSLLFSFLTRISVGTLPPGQDVVLHPLAFAGWVGLLVTALNLLPIGQLDGGHIMYALFWKKSKTFL